MGKRYLKQSWISPKLEVRVPALHGRGLFAKEPIAEGEVVVIWGGNFVQDEAKVQLAQTQGKAVQRIDKALWDIFDYEARHEDPAYDHNHPCAPNTWMTDEVTIATLRDILRFRQSLSRTVPRAVQNLHDCACHIVLHGIPAWSFPRARAQ